MAEIIKAINQLLANPGAFKLLAVAMATAVSYLVFSAWVSSLPMPTSASTPRYHFWFRFLNRLAGNMARAAHALLHMRDHDVDKCDCGHKDAADGSPPQP